MRGLDQTITLVWVPRDSFWNRGTYQTTLRPSQLLILMDGKSNDIDTYEGRYGIEDTRHAIIAAKRVAI